MKQTATTGKRVRRLTAAGVATACAGAFGVYVAPSGAAAQTVISVAADGSGDYTTVQEAVDAVPSGNSSEVTIQIAPGEYRGQVTVPEDKPYVTFLGMGEQEDEVTIVESKNAGDWGTVGSATVVVQGDDFHADNLTFANDFDENSSDTGDQALAAYLDADRMLLDDVRLLGDQDTVQVHDGARVYVSDSYIEGTVDFIYGGGIAVFHRCAIYEKRDTGGPITAASTPAEQQYGFLFHQSKIDGATDGTTQLGRPWRQDAQVLFRETEMSSTIARDQPWIDMSDAVWQNARFFEYGNTGDGAGVNDNSPQLPEEEADQYTPEAYLAGDDGWNPVG
jgi:pectinesterase